MSSSNTTPIDTARRGRRNLWPTLITALLILEVTLGSALGLSRSRKAPASANVDVPAGWQRHAASGVALWLPKGWRVNPPVVFPYTPTRSQISSFWEQLTPSRIQTPDDVDNAAIMNLLMLRPALAELEQGPALSLYRLPIPGRMWSSGKELFDAAVKTCACANEGKIRDKSSLKLGIVEGYRGIIESEVDGRTLRQAIYVLELNRQIWLLKHAALAEHFDEQLTVVKRSLRTLRLDASAEPAALGLCAQERMQRPIDELREVLAGSPRDVLSRAQQACHYLLRGNVVGAAMSAFMAAPFEDDRVRASMRYHEARAALGDEDPDQAFDLLTSAIALNEEAAYYAYRGYARSEQLDYEAAVKDYARAIDQGLKLPGLYYQRGVALQKTGDQAGAIADFSWTIEHAPADDPFVYYVYYMRGWSHQAELRHAVALQDMGRAIELKPSYGEVYWARGYSHAELGDSDKALEDYGRALDLGVGDTANLYYARALVYRDRGQEHVAAGRYDAAAKEFALGIADLDQSILLETDPGSRPGWYSWRADIYGERAAALQQSGAEDEARADWQRSMQDIDTYIALVGSDDIDPHAWVTRGAAYAGLGQPALAVQNYEQAWEKYEAREYLGRLQGDAHMQLGNHDRAIFYYGQALLRAPDSADLYHRLAQAYGAKGGYLSAIANMDEAIKRAPAWAPYYAERAGYHQRNGDLEAARADLRKASSLARGSSEKADYEKALRTLEGTP